MSLVKISCDERGIVNLSLNDPERRNAMSDEMAAEFNGVVEELSQNEVARVVILTGEGQAFAAGGDLHMLQAKAQLDAETNRKQMLGFYHSFLGIQTLRIPTIAAVNGHAIGAGLCLAMACDFRVISKSAKLGFTFSKLALHPGMGATLFVPRISGMAVALDLLVSGRIFTADEAKQMGMTREVVDNREVMPVSRKLADSLLVTGRQAVAGLLSTLRPSPGELQAALEREASEQSRGYAGDEFMEGVTATLEKRTPNFG